MHTAQTVSFAVASLLVAVVGCSDDPAATNDTGTDSATDVGSSDLGATDLGDERRDMVVADVRPRVDTGADGGAVIDMSADLGATDASNVDASVPVDMGEPEDACAAALGVSCGTFDEAYLKASNTGAGDLFGFSVSIDGDTLAVGAYEESSDATGVNGDEASNQATESGAVYVFTRSGATWTQQAYIKASNTGLSDFFGYAVALDGDTLAVGAYGENSGAAGIDGDQNDESAPQSGAVYVFTRIGTTWSQQAYIKASNPDADDFFGGAVALDGDTLAVGANREDSAGDEADDSAEESGAVYIFSRTGGAWSQQAYLKASNGEAGDNFGISVALEADSLVVGAYLEDSNATGVGGDGANNASENAGAAYVFTRAGASWTEQAYLKASNTTDGDIFGYTVAIEGDTVVVGAHLEDSEATGVDGDGSDDNTTNSGAAYVFTRSGTTWSQDAYLKASNPEGGDNFGFAVALSGDLLAVGVASEDGGAVGFDGDDTSNGRQNSGAVFLFSRASGAWSQIGYIKSSNPDPADQFGRAVALDADTLVVGALEEDGAATGVNGDQSTNSASRSGAAYVRRVAP